MRISCIITLVMVAATMEVGASDSRQFFPEDLWSTEAEALYRQQMDLIDLPFEPFYDEEVRHFLRRYVVTGRRQTQFILGRSILYFPVFEHFLQQRGLPDALKYLPFIESRLIPDVISPAGAGGFWQFIPATARLYGLRKTAFVDERFDVYRSTEMAVEMLADLYEDFGDWLLVIAAFNCGPSRVQQAMDATGCRTYREICHLLPGQTRKYVPKFMAAAYIANFYSFHRLRPVFPEFYLQDFRIMHLRRRISFRTVSRVCSLDRELIRRLNPGYLQDVVPGTGRGNYLILPADAMAALEAYLQPPTAVVENVRETAPRRLSPVAHTVRYTRDCLPPLDRMAPDDAIRPQPVAGRGSFAILSLRRRQGVQRAG